MKRRKPARRRTKKHKPNGHIIRRMKQIDAKLSDLEKTIHKLEAKAREEDKDQS